MLPLRKRPRRALTSLLAAGAVALAAAKASAAVITWDNPGEGLWSEPTNWSGDVVPAAGDDSRVNNGGTIVIDDTQAISSGFVVMAAGTGESGTVRMTGGSLTTGFDIRVGGNAGTGGGNGTFNLNGGTVQMNGGNLNVGFGTTANGTLNLSGGTFTLGAGTIAAIGNRGTGTVNHTGGDLRVNTSGSTAAVLQLGRNVAAGTGNGTYNLSGGRVATRTLQFGNAAGIAGSTNRFSLSGTGQLSVNAINVLNTNASNTFSFTGGTLTANTIDIPLTNGGGTLSPGNGGAFDGGGAIGNITLLNSNPYTQAAGALAIGIESESSYDTVTVGGNATLGGTVSVTSLFDFDPALDSTFDVLTALDITGVPVVTGLTPSGNAYEASIVPGGNGEVLRLTVVVPEPGTLSLVAAGGLGLLARRRRRS